MGLPKANRLRHRKDFQQVYRQGIRCSGHYLTLRAWQEDSQTEITPSRFGISISKKVSKKAVIRNRIKRQIKGAIRELLKQISPGWQVVLVVKPEARGCEYEHFLRELEKLLTKAEVLHGH
ncbi:MAG: ribonuclease P protein component [Spirulinaceae cyanobacterium]